MFCTNCGKKLSETAAFCTNCGTKLSVGVTVMSKPEEVKTVPQQERQPQAQQAEQPPQIQAQPAQMPQAQVPPPQTQVPPQVQAVPQQQRLQANAPQQFPPRAQPRIPQQQPRQQTQPRAVQGAAAAGHPAAVYTQAKPRNNLAVIIIAAAAILGLCAGAGIFFGLRLLGGDDDKNPRLNSAESYEPAQSATPENPPAQTPESPPSAAPEDLPVATPAPEDSPVPEDTPAPAEVPAEQTPEMPVVQARDFIIPDSDVRVLTDYDMAQFSNAELVIARNEIYARHGFIFGSKILIDWFSGKWWYTPVYESSEFPNSLLNEVENQNITLLLEYRNRRNNGEVPYQGGGAEDLYYYQYFYDSDRRYIRDSELVDMTKDNLEIAIWEVYAHHGLEFSDPRWREYYKSFTWYEPGIPESSWDDSVFNEYERANLDLMLYYYSQK